MKNALLGTTALVASGLLVGTASAADIVPAPIPEPVEIQEGFTLSIEADANAGIWFGETDSCDGIAAVWAVSRTGTNDDGETVDVVLSEGEIYSDGGVFGDGGLVTGGGYNTSSCVYGDTGEFHDDDGATIFYEHKVVFALEATLASGLFVGAYMENEKGGNAGWKDSWIVLEGNFGSMEIGFMDGAYKNAFTGGTDSGIYAEANGPKNSPGGDINTSDGTLDSGEGDMRIAYYTPRVQGIQFGVSYAPDSDDDEEYSDSQVHRYDGDDGWVDNWEVGLSWEGNISENWEFTVGGGYGEGTAETQIDDFEKCQGDGTGDTIADAYGGLTGDFECGDYEVWGVGAVVSNGQLTVGGAYSNKDWEFGFEREHWMIGAVISQDDWNFGVHYGDEEDTHHLGGPTDERELISVGFDKALGQDFVWGVFGTYANQHDAWQKAANGFGETDHWTIGTGWKIN